MFLSEIPFLCLDKLLNISTKLQLLVVYSILKIMGQLHRLNRNKTTILEKGGGDLNAGSRIVHGNKNPPITATCLA